MLSRPTQDITRIGDAGGPDVRENGGWGYMTASWALWPIWIMRSRIDRWTTSCADATSSRRRSGVARRAGRRSSDRTHGRARRSRLLHGGGPDLARAGDVLRTAPHPRRHRPSMFAASRATGLMLDGKWRNATMPDTGYLNGCRYLL